jgi:dATP pyrophosphohydrolase
MTAYKQPVSVLVVIYTPSLQVLLLERAAHPGFWQSVTGSREDVESLPDTARREVMEETGLDTRQYILTDWHITHNFEIFPEWRHRYAPDVTHNVEHVFSLQVPEPIAITTEPTEHSAYQWRHYTEAAALCFSWSNRDTILALPQRLHDN